MKKKLIETPREENLQALINYLTDNGVTDFNANILLHTNFPSLGEYRNIMDEIRDGNWDNAWNTVELYLRGDLW